MSKIKEVMDIIKKMSVLELSELTKTFEKEFDVKPIIPVAISSDTEVKNEKGPSKEEKTEFSVILSDVGANKISVIKAVRDITELGLKEAKELVEGAPKPIKESVSKEIAEEIKTKLEIAGAKVDLK